MVTAAIGAGLSLASAIYGGIQSAAANKRARRLIQRQREENKRWYDTKMAQDYTLRTDAQAAINRQRELLNEQYNRARKTGVVSGATNEAVAMQKEAANKALADTTSEIASQASAYKDRVEAQYKAQDSALNQQQIQNNQQQAAQTAQAASQAVSAGINVAANEAYLGGGVKGVTTPSATGSGELPSSTDLTALGNQQLGITGNGLPKANPIGYPVQKINA